MVRCGHYRIPWTNITKSALLLARQSLAQKVLAGAADSVLALARFDSTTDTQIEPNLLHLLRLTRGREASDPRDKVFALTGILNMSQKRGVETDYNLDTETVYSKCARLIVEGEEGVAILSSSLGVSQSCLNIPS